jgi:transcriptional regulator with XRE-family HTH domain
MKDDRNEDLPDPALAARLRAEREARGWSLAELAQRSGVSRAMISKVERGESSPTAALLGRWSGAFGLSLSQLLARVEGAGGRVQRAAEAHSWRDPATGFVRRALTPPQNAGPLELVDCVLPPRAEIAYPASAYAFHADQQIVVLIGELRFVQGAVEYQLKAGDCLRLGPPENCVYRNAGKSPCHYIVAVLRQL